MPQRSPSDVQRGGATDLGLALVARVLWQARLRGSAWCARSGVVCVPVPSSGFAGLCIWWVACRAPIIWCVTGGTHMIQRSLLVVRAGCRVLWLSCPVGLAGVLQGRQELWVVGRLRCSQAGTQRAHVVLKLSQRASSSSSSPSCLLRAGPHVAFHFS